MPGDSTKRYPLELKQRAVRMVAELAGEHDSEWAAMGRVAELPGVGTAETVRRWVRPSEVDLGARTGTTSDEAAELRRLRRENAELKRANAILKAASASRPSSTGLPTDRGVHPCARRPPGARWSAVGSRADLRGADRAPG